RQRSIIKLSGKLGQFSHYEMKGKYYTRRKTQHDVAHDPRFKNTHAKGLDFGTASRASKLLRTALGPAIKCFNKDRMPARMTSRFIEVVAADQTHASGQRQVLAENLASLKNFEFNKKSAFAALGLSPSVSIDRQNNTITIDVAAQDLQLAWKKPLPAHDP